MPINQTIGVAARPAGGQAFALTPSGRIPRSVLPQQVTGRLDASGGILSGTGFTVVKNATGDYTVTFIPPFTAIPIVLVGNTGTEQPWAQPIFTVAPSITGFRVNLRDSGNVTRDGSFQFIAFQV